MIRRFITASGLAVVTIVFAFASPAFADAGTNTNYSSVVTSISPPTPSFTARVTGGDSFLELAVQPGHVVIVEGYEHEPYLQILADGTVQTNEKSPATYLNNDRYAATPLPAEADAKAAPQWKTVATGGTYAWHSHLIHFMSPGTPEVLKQQGRESGFVQNWTINLTVDGVPTRISGTLNLLDAPSPFPSIVIALVIAGVGLLLLRKWTVAPLGVIAGGLAITVSAIEQGSIPTGTPTQTWVIVLGIVVVAFSLGALALRANRVVRSLCQLASGVVAVVWTITRVDVLRNAVLVSTLNPAVARCLVAVCGGLGCALVTHAIPGLAPSFDELDGDSPQTDSRQ